MASREEARFIDQSVQSDFVSKGHGFLVKGSPDWELDSTISLEMTDFNEGQKCWHTSVKWPLFA